MVAVAASIAIQRDLCAGHAPPESAGLQSLDRLGLSWLIKPGPPGP